MFLTDRNYYDYIVNKRLFFIVAEDNKEKEIVKDWDGKPETNRARSR